MSARLNFQFFSGSSIRARKRLRCSSFERCRKNLTMPVPLRRDGLHVDDRAVALPPEACCLGRAVGQILGVQDLGMHADDQDFLVVRAVEDADPPALRQARRGAPEEIVLELRRDLDV